MAKFWRALGAPRAAERDASLSIDQWAEFFKYGANTYGPVVGQGTLVGEREEPPNNFVGYVRAGYKSNGVVFACMLARLLLFSEARFQFRQVRSGRPGDYFGTTELGVLEAPWPNAATGDLLTRAIQDVDIAGNFYAVRRGDRIYRRRPDWMTIILGSTTGTEDPDEAELVSYMYQPGGLQSGEDPVFYEPWEVAHFAPIPDPEARYRGMSWLTPVLREIMADGASTSFKQRFFEQGATPNMVVSLDREVSRENFKKWVEMFRAGTEGAENAYKTMFLGGGAQAQVVGRDFQQIDFKNTQGAGETRIAAAAGVPPVIVGLSEGLEAATYSNYSQARRRFADGTMRPLWRNIAGSLSTLIAVPNGAELWYDDRDIPFLAEDVKDAAEVLQMQATTMKTLVDAGYTPDSVRDSVVSGDMSRLDHSGLTSVQLLPPGSPRNGNGAAASPATAD